MFLDTLWCSVIQTIEREQKLHKHRESDGQHLLTPWLNSRFPQFFFGFPSFATRSYRRWITSQLPHAPVREGVSIKVKAMQGSRISLSFYTVVSRMDQLVLNAYEDTRVICSKKRNVSSNGRRRRITWLLASSYNAAFDFWWKIAEKHCYIYQSKGDTLVHFINTRDACALNAYGEEGSKYKTSDNIAR